MENKEPDKNPKKEFTVPKDMEKDVQLGAAQQVVSGGAKNTCDKIENKKQFDDGDELAKETKGRVRVQGVDRTVSEYITRFIEISGRLIDIESIAYIHYREKDLSNEFFIDIYLKEGRGEPIIIDYHIKMSYEQDKTLLTRIIEQYHHQFVRGI